MWKNILGFLILISFIVISMYIIIKIINKNNFNEDISQKNSSLENTDLQNSSSSKIKAAQTAINDSRNQITNIKNNLENKNMNTVTLKTNMGDIMLELSDDKPKTTENFKKLVSEGFYNGVKFHRVIKGFMVQSGDPLSKDDTKKDYWGTGGPGYKFPDELTGDEKYTVGTLAMANSGPNTNGSQFFIMTSNTPLPPNYTVFGKVISGIDVAMKIQDVATDRSDKPLQDVIIKTAELK